MDLLVAACCRYHAPDPGRVVTEIGRCLTEGGRAILVTKSDTSYHDIDELLATSGLDPQATTRANLYHTFHSDNAERIVTAAGLVVDHRIDERHTFQITDTGANDAYQVAWTCPPETCDLTSAGVT